MYICVCVFCSVILRLMYAYDKGYLPFDINVTGGLSSEGVHIIKHHIVRVPDDDPQLIANVKETNGETYCLRTTQGIQWPTTLSNISIQSLCPRPHIIQQASISSHCALGHQQHNSVCLHTGI